MDLINKHLLFYSAIVLQIAVLLLVSCTFYLSGVFGKEVRLKTEPVDPRDLLYGDYVILQYDIQTLPKDLWQGREPITKFKHVYVVLEKQGKIYEAKAIYPKKPKVDNNEVVLTGEFDYFQDESTVYLSYGIERYYISEGTGKELEDKRDNLIVNVVIAPWGQKRINGIEVQKE